MKTIHATPTYVLEANLTHDPKYDIHTLEFWQTWPTMAKPYRRRVAQFNLPKEALASLCDLLSEDSQALADRQLPKVNQASPVIPPASNFDI